MALAVGKNHKVLLMMMRAFATSAAIASCATPTRGLGSGLGSGSQSKNSRSYLKLILCHLLPNSCPHSKFLPNRTRNKEVKKDLLSVGFGWLVRSVKEYSFQMS